MHGIVATISPGDSGDRVANFQAALLFLLDRDITLFFGPANMPTGEELKDIRQALGGEASVKVFDQTTRALTVAFRQRRGLGEGSEGVVDDLTAHALNVLLKLLGAFVTRPPYLVQGRITDSRGRPRAGLKVVAYDRDVRRAQELGASFTDAEGRYEIGYQIEDFLRAEGQALLGADLVVVVAAFDDEDVLKPLASSEVRFNAKLVETIDVEVEVLDKEPSEFERVTALVMPLLVDQVPPREELDLVFDPSRPVTVLPPARPTKKRP